MARGDHFFVWRRQFGLARFQHHGIDLGDGSAVHFTDGGLGVAGPTGNATHFQIKRTDLDVVTRCGRDVLHYVDYRDRLHVDETVERAIRRIGTRDYHLLFHNCEHFAVWCITDRHESRQVSVAFDRASSVGIKAIAAASVHVASRIGAKRIIRGASPWMLIADAAQWATEAGGHHVGLRNTKQRKQASRAVGATTALSIGALGGPVGIAVAGGLWCAGEVAGELSQAAYENVRSRRPKSGPNPNPGPDSDPDAL
ncbi:lecithin retinol acyltransferase family protein [Rubripirellula reticaptiva]|uniref:lecithin retinol acyltransferase family protein n=1 Tax=Rubripirellula reticaptiva TaxID=2528013 RepID=UPI001648333A|nr:lecithin retinol acyltransferase family protein [Rubripirellula reticaptiva]